MTSQDRRPAEAAQSLGILPLVHARGRHGELGYQVGVDRASQVRRMVETYRRLLRDERTELGVEDWSQAVAIARRYLPFIEEGLPQYVEEMRGLAQGAAVAFEDILVLNSIESITADRLHLGCTSLAVSGRASADGAVLVAHNEDWYPDDMEDVFLVHARPEGEPPFLAVSYGGLLPNIGFNAAGIAQCCDTVYATDVRLGIPRTIVARHVLTAGSIEEAAEFAVNPHRAAGYNHLLASAEGTIFNLEASAARSRRVPSAGGLTAHTNHYLSPAMVSVEVEPETRLRSRARLTRARRRLEQEAGHIDEAGLMDVLADHDGFPYSICSHVLEEPSPLDNQQTIASLVMDLTHRTMTAGWGNPCRATFAEFALPERW
ncbi:MAG TPA: C45 family peptidase [Anaerolineales bacterium]|nr:C45 family peptidase [Anaerolineales bacterium]